MESEPTPAHQTLESVFAFLRTDEWKVLVQVFEHYVRDANKKNIRAAVPFWTHQRKRDAPETHSAWKDIIAKLDSIKEAMRDLPDFITRKDHYYIRRRCDRICQNIVMIVNDYAAMYEGFTRYLQDKKYDTVKLHLLSFLHKIHDVFLLPREPKPPPDGYHNRAPYLCTWPDISAIPHNFKYRERPGALLIQGPDGGHSVAMPVQRDDRLEEHSMRSDSSGDEGDDSDDDMHASMRTWNFGHDSDALKDLASRKMPPGSTWILLLFRRMIVTPAIPLKMSLSTDVIPFEDKSRPFP
jgi:hypothetical protein